MNFSQSGNVAPASSTINIIDPVFFANKTRAEFRLNHEDVAYLSSGCYLCLGGFGTNAVLNQVNYNRRAGVAGMVSSIQLLNGGDVLAQLESAGSWMAFKGINKDNADAFSKQMSACSAGGLMNWGIIAGHEEIIADADGANSTGANIGMRGQPGISEDQSSLGYVAITEFLKELETLRVLPTSIFPNLRLVVQFTSQLTAILQQQSNTAGDVVSGFTKVRPILVVESISNPEVISSIISGMSATRMNCIESDQFVVPEQTDANNGRRRHQQQIRGFNSKIVNRILLVNQPTSATLGVIQRNADGSITDSPSIALDSGSLNSLVQNRLTINARVNGANIFQGQGLGYDDTQPVDSQLGAGKNHRLGCLTDTWGDVAICAGGNSCGLVVPLLNTPATINHLIAHKMGAFFYGSDYTGFRIMDRISHLEIDYGRSFVAGGLADRAIMESTAPNQQLNVLVYAEIPKVLQISGGSYRVAYL
jgi:hypothetical protein|tara:strand:+ start:6101 stop:7534 length:1434 start_codon:yes stop_codon:yes gene_type:complete